MPFRSRGDAAQRSVRRVPGGVDDRPPTHTVTRPGWSNDPAASAGRSDTSRIPCDQARRRCDPARRVPAARAGIVLKRGARTPSRTDPHPRSSQLLLVCRGGSADRTRPSETAPVAGAGRQVRCRTTCRESGAARLLDLASSMARLPGPTGLHGGRFGMVLAARGQAMSGGRAGRWRRAGRMLAASGLVAIVLATSVGASDVLGQERRKRQRVRPSAATVAFQDSHAIIQAGGFDGLGTFHSKVKGDRRLPALRQDRAVQRHGRPPTRRRGEGRATHDDQRRRLVDRREVAERCERQLLRSQRGTASSRRRRGTRSSSSPSTSREARETRASSRSAVRSTARRAEAARPGARRSR